MSIKALTPAEVITARINSIPEYVVSAVNKLLIEKCDNAGSISFMEHTFFERVQQEMIACKVWGIKIDITNFDDVVKHIKDCGWMKFEFLYRQSGWNVVHETGNTFSGYVFTPQ